MQARGSHVTSWARQQRADLLRVVQEAAEGEPWGPGQDSDGGVQRGGPVAQPPV